MALFLHVCFGSLLFLGYGKVLVFSFLFLSGNGDSLNPTVLALNEKYIFYHALSRPQQSIIRVIEFMKDVIILKDALYLRASTWQH
jgi:hypothetical protein